MAARAASLLRMAPSRAAEQDRTFLEELKWVYVNVGDAAAGFRLMMRNVEAGYDNPGGST